MPHTIGEDLLARDEGGRLRTRIATVFPRTGTIVTLPGIHATQRLAYAEEMGRRRVAEGKPPFTGDQLEEECFGAVDLVLEEDTVLIRPDPDDMPLAFEADELLQQVVPKPKIKFLHVLNPKVREAVKRRGECWRISPLPRSPEQMRKMIESSRIGIGGRDIYYYNNTTGTRFLTYQNYNELSALGDDDLRRHLAEIARHATRSNRAGCPEVSFFMADDDSLPGAFAGYDFEKLEAALLRDAFAALGRKFRDATKPEFRRDDAQCAPWRSRMYAALIGRSDKAVSEEALIGLSAEFFMQVEWLPGGRMEDGELIFDPVCEEDGSPCRDVRPGERREGERREGERREGEPLCDEKARGFIFNFIRDFGDLEYVNIGRVAGSLSGRQSSPGRRGVYLAEIKLRGDAHPILRILRMQKWGVGEHLDEGKDLLRAILEAEHYTEYILDRRLGCRQLGMNLPARVTARKVSESYRGSQARYGGLAIWSAYYERDYIPGLATDKVPAVRFGDVEFATGFARVLGRTAAPNLIVGRCDLRGQVIFDDGDELLVEDAAGVPVDVVVADPTGTFGDYRRDVRELAGPYAACVNRRVPHLADARAFGEVFLAAFVERFAQIQHEYRKRKRAFDTLFKHEPRDEGGNFRYRWECVLARLHAADPRQVADRIRQGFDLTGGAAARAAGGNGST